MSALELSRRSGVPQPQISKLLTGVRKRWSSSIEKLCHYANCDVPALGHPSAAEKRLSRALRQALGNHDDPRAVEVLARVIEAVTPAMVAMRATPSLEHPE